METLSYSSDKIDIHIIQKNITKQQQTKTVKKK